MASIFAFMRIPGFDPLGAVEVAETAPDAIVGKIVRVIRDDALPFTEGKVIDTANDGEVYIVDLDGLGIKNAKPFLQDEVEIVEAPEPLASEPDSIARMIEDGRAIEEAGFVFDASTGEVLRAPEDAPASVRERFAVVDQGSAEWVLRKMLEAEAELSAVDTHPQVIAARAIVANAERMKTERARRVKGLYARFETELGEFAKTQLVGKRAKTFKTVFGAISLRVKKGGLRVADEAQAIAWAQAAAPDAIKVETKTKFLVTALTPEQRLLVEGIVKVTDEEFETAQAEMASDPAYAEQEGEAAQVWRTARAAFRVDPDEEKVDVKTIGKDVPEQTEAQA